MTQVPYWVFNERSLKRTFNQWSKHQQALGAKPAQLDFIHKAMMDMLKSPEAIEVGIVQNLKPTHENNENHD